MKRGNWTDRACYYVSTIDGKRINVVGGPFRTHQEALDMVEVARELGCGVDWKSWFYGWGTVKMNSGHSDGILNTHLGI